ncbi:MAG: PilZ domain-containing protein [Candidatus Brocadiaceae bacterium]|nr:PilZ domain-containing protein [Candidatus Brocadiaceae bacterium]
MINFNGHYNKRQYLRVNVPIINRPASFTSSRTPIHNIGLGGIRVYSDDKIKLGELLELELFLPDNTSFVCKAKVVWQKPLPEGAKAKYDLGLQFTEVPSDIMKRLSGIIEKEI